MRSIPLLTATWSELLDARDQISNKLLLILHRQDAFKLQVQLVN